MVEMEDKMRDWFTKKFVEWQASTGTRQTLDSFAAYLGVSRSTLSKYMNGDSRPGNIEFVEKISDKLGFEIYDLMEIPRPDPNLVYIIKSWPALSNEQRREIREQAEKYHAQSNALDGRLGEVKPKSKK